MFVADASFALAWVLEDECSDRVDEVLEQMGVGGVCVPSHWSLEVTNGLLAAARRGRIDVSDLHMLIPDLRAMIEETDLQTEREAWEGILSLAWRRKLTSYDAAYLELCLRKKLPLATLDEKLATAARLESATVLPD